MLLVFMVIEVFIRQSRVLDIRRVGVLDLGRVGVFDLGSFCDFIFFSFF